VNEPPRVFFGQTVSGREWDHMAMFAWLSAPESVPRSTLHSEQIPEKGEVGGQNYKGYSNPRMDALIDRMERELDDDARVELWHELLEIYARDLPALPLYWRAQAYVLPRWLTGVAPTGHQYPTTLWVEDWGVRGNGANSAQQTDGDG
jgi:peptide/nickel transport system substrate-binding protein